MKRSHFIRQAPLVYWFVGIWFLSGVAGAHENHHSPEDTLRPGPLKGESIYQVHSQWTTQDTKDVRLVTLRGHPVILAMVYTSCQAACPLIVADLKRIESNLSDKERAEVRFALFSLDTTKDTPSQLRLYAKAHSLDLTTWTLFHGSQRAVRELAAVLGIRYKQITNGDFDHSNVITVLDRDGVIQHQQVGLRQDPKDTLQKLSALLEKK